MSQVTIIYNINLKMLLYCIILLLSVCSSLAQQKPLVKTTLGLIEGYHKQSYNGHTFSAFEGIPYAKPPIGELRFEKPVEIEPWIGIWNANIRHKCSQLCFFSYEVSGDEDCLYLNVYVPNKTPTSKDNLDVIVHIHGGAFTLGSPGGEGPVYLMDRNIIFVNMNYRLSALGFLSTEDDVVPGNNGLKDQVLALQWVQKHIKQFGGNPKSVTLTGFSAGGASAHLHYFSKLSKGLFHRGVSYSGTALSSWAIQDGALERSKKLALLLGCEVQSTQVFVNCMKQKSARQILNSAQYLYTSYKGLPIVTFAPVVENTHNSESFLTDYPYKLLIDKDFNDVPWMTSVTSEDGILILSLILHNLNRVNNEWDDLLPYIVDYNNYTSCDSDKSFLANKIKEYYFGNKMLSEDTIESLIKMFGERCFTNGFVKSSRLHTKFSNFPVYSYIYKYGSSFSAYYNKLLGINKNYGISHGEDISLIYKDEENNFKNWNLSKSDEFIKDLLLDTLTSYAKTNQPRIESVEWHSVEDSNDFSYLLIESPDKIRMMSEHQVSSNKFWDSLPLVENDKISKSFCDDKNDNLNKVEL